MSGKGCQLNRSIRNTIQCIDSATLPRDNPLFDGAGPKPRQDSVPAGLTLAGNFGFCF